MSKEIRRSWIAWGWSFPAYVIPAVEGTEEREPRTPAQPTGGDRRTRGVGRPFGGGGMQPRRRCSRSGFLSHLEQVPGCADLSSLVAITFTERAAREMRETHSQGVPRGDYRTADAIAADHWLAIVREMDSARISTIHSFCSSLLRSHAVEAGIDPAASNSSAKLAGAVVPAPRR